MEDVKVVGAREGCEADEEDSRKTGVDFDLEESALITSIFLLWTPSFVTLAASPGDEGLFLAFFFVLPFFDSAEKASSSSDDEDSSSSCPFPLLRIIIVPCVGTIAGMSVIGFC